MTIAPVESRLDDPGSIRLGTFSYLPPLTVEQVERQVAYALARGWTWSVEHVEPARASTDYWYLWRLPFFGASTTAEVMAEVDACRRARPHDHVRLVAYDARRQTRGLVFAVQRGGAT